MRKRHVLALFAVALVMAGCGGGTSGSGDHSVSDVKSAMRAVGLSGFRAISKAQMRRSNRTPGVGPDQIAGAFSLARLNVDGSQTQGPTHTQTALGVVALIVVAKDPAVMERMEREVRKENLHDHLNFRQTHTGNVLILSGSDHPDARGRRILARIPKLVAYLDGH